MTITFKIMVAGIGFSAAAIFAQEKPCQMASKFGPDDQLGNVRYITQAKTIAA
jgi:hypothetical protein